MEDAQRFRKNFDRIYRESDFSSYRSLSLDASLSPSRAQKIASGDFDFSKDGPGIFGVARMCRSLGTDPNKMLGFEALSVDALIRCFVSGQGAIGAFDKYLKHCDIYARPEEESVVVRGAGSETMASQHLPHCTAQTLQKAYSKGTSKTRHDIWKGQLAAWEHKASAFPARISDVVSGKELFLNFVRAGFRVHMPDASERLLIFCIPI